MASKFMLGKMEMPGKKKSVLKPEKLGFAESEMDEAEEDAEEMPDPDMANELVGEGEGDSEEEDMGEMEDSSELSSIPDKDLLAEIKKRGLMSKLGSK